MSLLRELLRSVWYVMETRNWATGEDKGGFEEMPCQGVGEQTLQIQGLEPHCLDPAFPPEVQP